MKRPGQEHFDIAYVGTFRESDPGAAVIAGEISVHARAGYSTVLVPLDGPDWPDREPVHPVLDALVRAGQAVVARPESGTVTAALAVIHDPAALAKARSMDQHLEVGQTLVVANRPLVDLSGMAAFDIVRADELARGLTRREVAWTSAWPNIGAQLACKSHAIEISNHDWRPVIDPERWAFKREAPDRLSPTIGRHGRPEPDDWPDDLTIFLSRYPVSRHVNVSLLGVYRPRLEGLGRTPRNWTLFPQGSIAPERFLRSIDLLVYYPRWKRRSEVDLSILEGLASGAVAVLPQELEPYFGQAALYPNDGREALELMVTLFRDGEAFLAQIERGQAYIREKHGPQIHLDRLSGLVGAPARGSPVPPRAKTLPSRAARTRRPLLFVSSNGIGLGHVSRLLAIANRLGGHLQPIFATMSQGLRVIREAGYHAEHIPFHAYLECNPDDWNSWLRHEMSRLIEFFGIEALIYDGGSPYHGIFEAVANTANVKSVWCRRAMWRDSVWEQAIDQAKFVDLIVEPGELAASRDIGATVAHRDETQHVDPILLLDEADVLSRKEARQRLGLEMDRPAVLIQLGSGNHLSLVPAINHMIATLERFGGFQVVIAEWMIADRSLGHWPHVRRLTGFPNALYFRAFDFVISSAGYNSFHELLNFGIPAVFAPIEVSYLDNQLARATFAADEEMALCLRLGEMNRFSDVLQQIMDPQTRDRLARSAYRNKRPNGATAAASMIADLVG